MATSIEDILLLKAQQDAVNREDNGLAAAAGALVGAGAGYTAGVPVHAVGQLGLKLKDRLNNTQPSMLRGARPGARMAGGLVGAVLGGALGPQAKQAMMGESEAASLLAKIQSGGDMTPNDQVRLEELLTDTYNTITS